MSEESKTQTAANVAVIALAVFFVGPLVLVCVGFVALVGLGGLIANPWVGVITLTIFVGIAAAVHLLFGARPWIAGLIAAVPTALACVIFSAVAVMNHGPDASEIFQKVADDIAKEEEQRLMDSWEYTQHAIMED